MKTFKQFVKEAWVEFEKKIAGNAEDPLFHPSQSKDPVKDTKPMVNRLNRIMVKRKRD
jgi:hypothetical protein